MLLLTAREFRHILKPAPKSVELVAEGKGERGGRGKSVVVGHIKTDVSCDLCDIL